MQTANKIIIVCGGIGGAATALALHRAGFEPVVYERTPELRFCRGRYCTLGKCHTRPEKFRLVVGGDPRWLSNDKLPVQFA